MRYLLSIDIGTSSLKASLFAEDRTLLSTAVVEYALRTPRPEIVEIDAERYWEACRQGVRGALDRAGVSPAAVAAIGLSSQGETLICVDRGGEPLRPAIVWLDGRSAEQAERIGEVFGAEEVYRTTGQPEVVPTWTATKILWLREKEPETFGRTEKFLLVEDYMIRRLAGRCVGERSLMPSTLYFDIRSGRWWDSMLEFLGIDAGRLPELLDSGARVGPLTAEAARELGLTTGTIVATGALDQIAGALGGGGGIPGVVTETTGSALAVAATVDRPVYDPRRRIPCQYGALPGTYVLLAWGQTAGMALGWWRDLLGAGISFESLCDEAARVPAGSDGLSVLPHLAGAACPEFEPRARGVLFGLGLGHGRRHVTRAILESVAYMLRRNVEVLESLGIEVRRLRSLGGGARSRLWCQIKADVLERPVARVACEEAAGLGAAMLAGSAIGMWPGVAEAARSVAVAERFEPDPSTRGTYRDGYRRYVELFDAVRPLFGWA